MVAVTRAQKKRQFNQILFRWHKTHYRPMRWRATRDPYRILVSEIMLQQTQVERVRRKYSEFLKIFPTVHALAAAPLARVLHAWQGLGYNRRAKYLHECAKIIVGTYGGKFPRETKELRALPGIGISTAAAIRSFAFGIDEPMIDTNIRRILSRTFWGGKIYSDDKLFAFARSLIPKGRGREWNYAMLDLGATVCTARHHADDCPMRRLHGLVSDFQYKKPQGRFRDSDRYWRGVLLRALVRGRRVGIRNAFPKNAVPAQRAQQIIRGMIRDGLVIVRGLLLTLP